MYYSMDPTYMLILIGMAISMLAQAGVTSAYRKYSQVHARSNYTGAMAANRFLLNNGVHDVQIAPTSGTLTDFYNPADKTLRLSSGVFGASSVAALAIAAHECGHAVQDATGYAPLKLRRIMVPAANFGAKGSWILFMAGLLLGYINLLKIGVILFLAVLAFQLVTLPVEFDASRRGLRMLEDCGILAEDEMPGARKVLRSAAWTYVAAVIASLFQLLRFVMIINGGRRRR